MKEIDLSKAKIKREYKSGIRFSNGAERIFEYTINLEGSHIHGLKFYSSTWTPKRGDYDWGKGKTVYFWDTKAKKPKEFGELIECVKDLAESTMHKV